MQDGIADVRVHDGVSANASDDLNTGFAGDLPGGPSALWDFRGVDVETKETLARYSVSASELLLAFRLIHAQNHGFLCAAAGIDDWTGRFLPLDDRISQILASPQAPGVSLRGFLFYDDPADMRTFGPRRVRILNITKGPGCHAAEEAGGEKKGLFQLAENEIGITLDTTGCTGKDAGGKRAFRVNPETGELARKILLVL